MASSFTRPLRTLVSLAALTAAEGLLPAPAQDIYGQKPKNETTTWTVAERSQPVCENQGRVYEPNANGSCPDIRVSGAQLINNGKPVVFTVLAAKNADGSNAISGLQYGNQVCVVTMKGTADAYQAPRVFPCGMLPEIQSAVQRGNTPPASPVPPAVLWYLQQQQKGK